MRRTLILVGIALAVIVARPAAAQNITTVAGGVPNNVSAPSAILGTPAAIAFDPAGNYYIGGFGSAVFKVDASGSLTTIAGNGIFGNTGDGGPATAAEVGCPTAIALDSAANLFIGDQCASVIRRVDAATKIITTVAGNGSFGYTGNGGSATAAELGCPTGVAIDSGGNLFIADQCNAVVRRVDGSTKIITTVAGNGSFGYTGNGGLATAAALSCPAAVAFDTSNDLFIADSCDEVVRRVDAATKIITTVAGNGISGYTGDGGLATAAELGCPTGVAVDATGRLSIADQCNAVIRRVDLGTRIISTFAGNGTAGYAGDGGLAIAAELQCPTGVASDSSGNLFIADECPDVVRRVDAGTGDISTTAGGASPAFTGEGGLAAKAQLLCPAAVAEDAGGNLFIADECTFAVRRVDAFTKAIHTIAGNGTFGYSGDGTAGAAAQLCDPFGVAVDAFGDVFIADECNSVVRRVDAFTGNIATYAGNGISGYSGDGGLATSAKLNCPTGVASDPVGNLFIVDQCANVVRRVDATTRIITPYAGTGVSGYSGDGGAATAARLACPLGASLDAAGDLFVSDQCNNVVRRIDAVTKTISTVAGDGISGFSGNGGLAASARLACPAGVAVDPAGNLFIADQCNSDIRRVDAATKNISTYAGNETDGFSGDGSLATAAQLGCPQGVALDGFGDLFIGDPCDLRVREVSVSIPPSITSVNGATFTAGVLGSFTVTAAGAPFPALSVSGGVPAGVTFVDNGNGTAILSGVPGVGTGGTYNLTFGASNGVGTDASQSFTLTVIESPAIASSANATFTVGMPGSFTVTTTGSPLPALTETGPRPTGINFVDNGNGTATLSGTPASGTGGTYSLTIKASNGVGTDASQNFTLSIVQAPAITSGASATFTVGTAGSFTVTATGSPLPSLTETGARPTGVNFVDNGNGTATLSGTPASGSGGTYGLTIKASNGVGTDSSQSFTLIVTQPPVITSAGSAAFTVGSAGTFIVNTTGFPAPSLIETGALPTGVAFTDNGNGTAALSGTPASGSGGIYNFSIKAANTVGSATQSFTLAVQDFTISASPASMTISSGRSAPYTINLAAQGGLTGNVAVSCSGGPPNAVCAVSPASVALDGSTMATVVLGTPMSANHGTFTLTLTGTLGGLVRSTTVTLTVK